MSDIVLSYAREDQARAERLAGALAAPLADWTGAPGHGGFQALCEGIAHRLDLPTAPALTGRSDHRR